MTGTYAIVIDPGSMSANDGSSQNSGADQHQPPPANLNFRVGQNARLTFEGTAGQRVSVGLSDLTLGVGYCCEVGTISMQKPDGTVLMSQMNFNNNGIGTASQVLPVSGTYAIVVDPWFARFGTTTVTFSEDLAPPITVNGPVVNMTFRAGQNARLTFAGTSGQQITVHISGNTVGSTIVTLYKPDGTSLTSANSNASSFNLAAQTLPVTGTYSVQVDPNR